MGLLARRTRRRLLQLALVGAVLVLGAAQPLAQDARAGDDPESAVASRSVGLLPIASRWVPASAVAVVLDTLIEVGREEGLTIVPLDRAAAASCWGNDRCYLDAVRGAVPHAIALEVVKTSSGRLHITVRFIDVAGGTVRRLGRVRSFPAVLGRSCHRWSGPSAIGCRGLGSLTSAPEDWGHSRPPNTRI